MTARHLVVGLDGADLTLVRELGPERLPTLHALMARGAYAHQRSVLPPATLPNWTTFLTGVDPAVHGVFDFTTRRGYRVRFTAGTVRAAPTVISRLDRLGLACACIGFPATYPPDRLEHGVFISGWDAPVAFEADRSFVWPPALHDAIVERFGPYRFDDVDEFDADSPGWHARLPEALVRRVERKAELAGWLLDGRPWDLFACYFGESDTAAHHLMSLHDPASPRRPRGAPQATESGLARVYAALDAAVAELVSRAGGEGVEVTLVSDHGSGGSSDKVLYLNHALAEAGLLRFARGGGSGAAVGALKQAALTRLPPRLREAVFRWGGTALPSFLESRARFGAIDMGRTAAFSDELNYFPSVHLNLRDREPKGTVRRTDADRVVREVREALLALRDPWSGAPVVAAVHRREELFEGPLLERAPDLLLQLHLDGGYSYNLMPSGGARPTHGPFRRLSAGEYLGRKGRSLPGSHRERGLFVAAGPGVAACGELDTHIADGTATLLARMGLAVPPELAGRVLWEALATTGGEEVRALPEAPSRPQPQGADEARIESRLRALGYIE
ncbi:MAG: alkaline phosphatase family protein [Myxococcota bacterium]